MDALTYGTLVILICSNSKGKLNNAPDLLAKIAMLVPVLGMLYRVHSQVDLIKNALVLQQDYETFECGTYEIDGISFYYPIDDVRAGYYAFPATRWKVEEVHALGNSIEYGFAVDKVDY